MQRSSCIVDFMSFAYISGTESGIAKIQKNAFNYLQVIHHVKISALQPLQSLMKVDIRRIKRTRMEPKPMKMKLTNDKRKKKLSWKELKKNENITQFITFKAIRGCCDLHYDSKGKGDLCGWFDLVYDPKGSQGQ